MPTARITQDRAWPTAVPETSGSLFPLPIYYIHWDKQTGFLLNPLFKIHYLYEEDQFLLQTLRERKMGREGENIWESESFPSQIGRFWQLDAVKILMVVQNENVNKFNTQHICKIIILPQSLSRRKSRWGNTLKVLSSSENSQIWL